MSEPSPSALHQQVAGTFIGPVFVVDGQPDPVVTPTDWGAYDVPRLWAMIRQDDLDEGAAAFQQARGFENLAQLLLAHHDSLRSLAAELTAGWDRGSNLAAAEFFALLDGLLDSLADDAIAHSATSRALDSILSRLRDTQTLMRQYKADWDRLTTDWTPEWWDQAAAQLNEKARHLATETDTAVGEDRRRIILPVPHQPPQARHAITSGQSARIAQRRSSPPAPDSSYEETGRGGELGTSAVPQPPPSDDAVQSGGTQLQSASPASPRPVAGSGPPISVLPIPPGNPYLPGGGLYVLPGPGVGKEGRIYAMPTAGTTAGRPGAAPTAPPLSQATGPPPHPHPARGRKPGPRSFVWHVAQGVDPVIGDTLPPDNTTDETFATWFADLATPWDRDMTVFLGDTEVQP